MAGVSRVTPSTPKAACRFGAPARPPAAASLVVELARVAAIHAVSTATQIVSHSRDCWPRRLIRLQAGDGCARVRRVRKHRMNGARPSPCAVRCRPGRFARAPKGHHVDGSACARSASSTNESVRRDRSRIIGERPSDARGEAHARTFPVVVDARAGDYCRAKCGATTAYKRSGHGSCPKWSRLAGAALEWSRSIAGLTYDHPRLEGPA